MTSAAVRAPGLHDSESIVLQTECVCKTAPAPRRRTISTWSSVSADGLPRAAPDDAAALVALEDVGRAQRALGDRAGGDREAQRLARDTTALKLPLVPSTQPRA